MSLKIYQKTPASESFVKSRRIKTFNFIKKDTLAKKFSCEFCKIFKNLYFVEHLRKLLMWKYLSYGIFGNCLLGKKLFTQVLTKPAKKSAHLSVKFLKLSGIYQKTVPLN